MNNISIFQERLNEIFQIKPLTPKVAEKTTAELYNIHKRSLPEGLDIPILFNLSKKEIDYWLKTRLKAGIVKIDEKDVLIYYDPVNTTASHNEKSIYWNSDKLIKHEENIIENPL